MGDRGAAGGVVLLVLAAACGCSGSGDSAADAGPPPCVTSAGFDGSTVHDGDCWQLVVSKAARTEKVCVGTDGPSWCYGVDLVLDAKPGADGKNHRLIVFLYHHDPGAYREAGPMVDELTFNGTYVGGLGTLDFGARSHVDVTSYTYSPTENHQLALTFELELVDHNTRDLIAKVTSGTLTAPSVVDETCGSRQVEADASCAALLTRCPQLEALKPSSSWIDPNGGSTDDAIPIHCDMSDRGWARLIPQYRAYSWYHGTCGNDDDCRPPSTTPAEPFYTFPGGSGDILYETGVLDGPIPAAQRDALIASATTIRAPAIVWTYDVEPGCDAGYSATLNYYAADPLSGPSTDFCSGFGQNDAWSQVDSAMPTKYFDNRVLRSVDLGTGGDWIFYYEFVDQEVWLQ